MVSVGKKFASVGVFFCHHIRSISNPGTRVGFFGDIFESWYLGGLFWRHLQMLVFGWAFFGDIFKSWYLGGLFWWHVQILVLGWAFLVTFSNSGTWVGFLGDPGRWTNVLAFQSGQ